MTNIRVTIFTSRPKLLDGKFLFLFATDDIYKAELIRRHYETIWNILCKVKQIL
jgi:hypothetical protein